MMADIYGTRNGPVEQLGLADADDCDDYTVKSESLRLIWEGLVPGFCDWFDKRQSNVFKLNLIMSARKHLCVSGRFYSNRLENNHMLLKKDNKGARQRKGDYGSEYGF